MKREEQKKPWKEVLRLTWRAMRELHRLDRQLLPSTALYAVVQALIPYASIFFSARILGELSMQRRPEVLWTWVLWAVVGGGALALLNTLLLRWKAVHIETFAYRKESLFGKKMFSLDFADVDDPATLHLRSQIKQAEQFHGWGFYRIPEYVAMLVSACAGILSAVALTCSLFTAQVPSSAGGLTVLNHPVFLLTLLLALLGLSALTGLLNAKAAAWEAGLTHSAMLGNRIFCFYGFSTNDTSRAADIRLYNQQDLIAHHWSMPNAFSASGAFGKLSRGKKGVCNGVAAGVSAIFTGAVYLFTGLKAWGGAFHVGAVTQYVGAVTALSSNVSRLIELCGQLRSNAEFLDITYTFLDIPNAMYQGSLTTEKRSDRKYQVEFKDVSFKYPGSQTWALRHVSIRFEVGKRLAVVGENGSGKTTFIKLLCRLYDPQEGQILLNGIDIRKYNYRDYMNLFSVVFQDFQLLSQPLGANVAGSQNYDAARVRRVLIDAGFGERLAHLPDGLDTMLYKEFAEDGIELSGGEAQKVAIARALYKDAPFIILDEPTAALDPVAEAEIYSRFDEIAGDKTAVYISHRLSSCVFCDEIVVFDHGAILQRGTHEALLSDASGKYRALWHAQAQYYIAPADGSLTAQP